LQGHPGGPRSPPVAPSPNQDDPIMAIAPTPPGTGTVDPDTGRLLPLTPAELAARSEAIERVSASSSRPTRPRRTSDPIRANIAWADVESMLFALGATMTEGRGSRVRVELNGVRAVFHRPHPQKETKKGVVRALRDYLREANAEIPEADESGEE
jgi:HicA toxin of bacterial toxin-antitoxin,